MTTVAANAPTLYPFRQALSLSLVALITSKALPALNADLAAQMGANAPRFAPANVVRGSLESVTDPTLCVVDGADDCRIIAAGKYELTLTTRIEFKTAFAAGNTPEAFAALRQSVTDHLSDLLTSAVNNTIAPVNAAGQRLLPPGVVFQDCYYLGARPLSFPNSQADKVVRCRGSLLLHQAQVRFDLARAYALGSRP